MPSPFPGMDPYIESAGLWEDFHQNLVPEIHRALSQKLPDRYVSRLDARVYVETPSEQWAFLGKPDVAVAEDRQPWTPEAKPSEAVALADPVILPASMGEEYKEVFLEIREVPGLRLVTVVEVLSATNKHPGHAGWELYVRKRRSYEHGRVNLVEIDLLRAGRRPPMAAAWPPGDYYILVARAGRWHACQVWPFTLRDRVPPVPVPLASPDPDVIIDLQPLIQDIYDRGRYVRTIDYRDWPRPRMSDEDASWLDRVLAEARLRPVAST